MSSIDPKKYLWSNIQQLMAGLNPPVIDVGIDAVKKKTGVGRGTVQRIRDGETSVGIDILVTLADAFGVKPWILLMPGLKSADSADENAEETRKHNATRSTEAIGLATLFDAYFTTDITRKQALHAVFTAIEEYRTKLPVESPIAAPPNSRRIGKQHE